MQEIINRVKQKIEDPVYKFGFHSGAEAIKEARLIIEQIVQEYDMGWIPVSERLPTVQDISVNMCPCFLTTEKYQSTAQRRTFNIISGSRTELEEKPKC